MSALSGRVQAALGEGYEVQEELGGGGMSRLFVALDRNLGRRVVVKLLPEDRLLGLSPERFQREIRLTAQLSHPNIVGILAAGVLDGIPYYIMPFVEGRSLRVLLDERGALPVRDAVSILRDVARACAFAHAKGVIHRDIKPGNVLIAGGAAVITDFGVAKAIVSSAVDSSAETDATITRAGFTIGTPAYMAPEQAAGDASLDARADLYALGVMAFEMLSGHVPFEGRTPRELLAAQLTHAPPSLDTIRSDVPAGLAALIARCLAKDPSGRPAGAEQVLTTLEDLPVASGSQPVLRAIPASPARRRTVMAGVAVLALAAFGILRARGSLGGSEGDHGPVTLAVLPFARRSADSTDAYLAEGLTDAITSALARDSALRLASRLATAEYAERVAPPREIGRSLHVMALLDGTVQRQGDRIRVTVQLVDTRTGAALWSESYDRQSADLMAVQADIAGAIVTAFERQRGGPAPGAAGPHAGFRVPEAYDRYLQGRYAFGQRGVAMLREAVGHFRAAVALDSAASPAWSGLADAYVLLPLYGGMPVDSALGAALDAADRAVRLDPKSSEALASRGVVHLHRWEWKEAAADLASAVALDPRNAAAEQWRGELLMVTGRLDEAAAAFRRAMTLDERAPLPAVLYGFVLGAMGQADSGAAVARAAARRDPSLAAARLIQGAILLGARREVLAIGALEAALALEADNVQALGLLGYAYGRLGDRKRAQGILSRLAAMGNRPDVSSAMARVQLGLGNLGETFAALEKAVRNHDPFFTSEPLDGPIFAPLKGDPRLATLRGELGLVP